MILIRNTYIIATIISLGYMQNKVFSLPLNTNKDLNTFNKLMEKIEYNFNNDNINEACINSLEAVKKIDTNIEEFKQIQPNYSWIDIKNLLEIIPRQICPNLF